MKDIERVVLVHRLREVVAQVGFTRFEAAAPDIEGELEMGVRRASLAREVSWLPAVENQGRRHFHSVQDRSHRAMDASDRTSRRVDATRCRVQLLEGRAPRKPSRVSRTAVHHAPFLLAHAHHSGGLECGYPASSIRERIYALPGIGYGVLLYTGTSDAEGTLGGLIQVGRRIHEHIQQCLGTRRALLE